MHSHVRPLCIWQLATRLAFRRRHVVTSAEAAALAYVQSGLEVTVSRVKGARTPCGDVLAANADIGAGEALAGAHGRDGALRAGVVAQAHRQVCRQQVMMAQSCATMRSTQHYAPGKADAIPGCSSGMCPRGQE